MSPPLPRADHFPGWVAAGAACWVLGLLLLATGQPILSDDFWFHLALGRAYAAQGPWLAGDPLLADALGPPLPSAWLADLVFYFGQVTAGFQGLRLLHVSLVAALLWLAGSALRRASGSLLVAGLATSAFAILSAYRVVQIRPHLFTLLAVLLLYRLLFEHRKPPSWLQIAGAAALCGAWANLHAGFVLGPLFMAAGLAGTLGLAVLAQGPSREQALHRAKALGWALVLGGLATAINPSGFDPHLAYWSAGQESPTLGQVADEWTRVQLFAWPVAGLPPSLLTWGIYWCLWGLTPVALLVTLAAAWRSRKNEAAEPSSPDPALAAMAAAALLAPLFGVRFLWLGILPLLLLAQASRLLPTRAGPPGTGPLAWIAAAASIGLALAFVRVGPWPMISSIMPRTLAGYAAPYPAAKYPSEAVWMLHDAGLEGALFGKYSAGGYFGYWLSPRILTFINGSLNVAPETMAANRPILEARGRHPGESLTDLLDRQGIDLFLGARLPLAEEGGRPLYSTIGHLENTPGWIPVFRNLSSAVYLRDNPRNQDNLERVAQYYRRQGVPFHRERGFEVARVIASRPDWAIGQGIVPTFFPNLARFADPAGAQDEAQAARFVSSLYALLGVYETSMALDRQLLEAQPNHPLDRRRLTWSLLRSEQFTKAATAAEILARDPSPVSQTLVRAARAAAEGDLADGQIRLVPLFSEAEGLQFSSGIVRPRARP